MKQLHAKCKGKRRHASKVMRNIFSPYNVINLFWQTLIIQGRFAVPFVSSCMLRRDPAINNFLPLAEVSLVWSEPTKSLVFGFAGLLCCWRLPRIKIAATAALTAESIHRPFISYCRSQLSLILCCVLDWCNFVYGGWWGQVESRFRVRFKFRVN